MCDASAHYHHCKYTFDDRYDRHTIIFGLIYVRNTLIPMRWLYFCNNYQLIFLMMYLLDISTTTTTTLLQQESLRFGETRFNHLIEYRIKMLKNIHQLLANCNK